MTPRIDYTVVRVPSDDWNNVAETLAMDMESSSFSFEIRNEIAAAFENMRDFSMPWVVTIIKEDDFPKAYIFQKEEAAKKYIEEMKRKLPRTTQIFCAKASYRVSPSSPGHLLVNSIFSV